MSNEGLAAAGVPSPPSPSSSGSLFCPLRRSSRGLEENVAAARTVVSATTMALAMPPSEFGVGAASATAATEFFLRTRGELGLHETNLTIQMITCFWLLTQQCKFLSKRLRESHFLAASGHQAGRVSHNLLEGNTHYRVLLQTHWEFNCIF